MAVIESVVREPAVSAQTNNTSLCDISYAAAYLCIAADIKARLGNFDEKLCRAAQSPLAGL